MLYKLINEKAIITSLQNTEKCVEKQLWYQDNDIREPQVTLLTFSKSRQNYFAFKCNNSTGRPVLFTSLVQHVFL